MYIIMSTIPKVTIMIPTHNQSNYVLRAIDSALMQDYKNLEIIISNDQSTDDSDFMIKKHLEKINCNKIKYIYINNNLGRLKNYYNTLYNHATGDWIINLDGDDFFINNSFISNAINLTFKYPSIVLVFGNYCEYYQDKSLYINIYNKNLSEEISCYEFFDLFATNKITWNHCSILYKRTNAINIGFYWNEISSRNDWESFLRLIVNNNVSFLNQISAAWTQHSNNETKKTSLQKYLNNFELIKGVSLFSINNGMSEKFINNWTNKMFYKSALSSAVGYIISHELREGIIFLKHIYMLYSINPLKILFNPGIIIRILLSIYPNFYLKIKSIIR